MTRQKKELEKRIEYLYEMQEIDTSFAGGYYDPDLFRQNNPDLDELELQLAHLRHFDSVDEMYMYQGIKYEEHLYKTGQIPFV